MRIPFGFQSYDIRPASRQRNINCHVVQNPQGAKSPLSLTRAPGVDVWCSTLPAAPTAWEVHNGDLFAVANSVLYRVASNGSVTSIGTVGAATDMASSGTELLIVTGGTAYSMSNALALTEVTDASFQDWDWAEWLDGYFIGGTLGEQQFYWSALGDGTTYDSLDTAAVEARPDGIVDVLVDHREIVFAGSDSMEIWYNAGGNAQFIRIPNGTIELGCIGKTLAALENSFYWLASDYTVRRLEGLSPVRVSNDAVEAALYGVTDAVGFSWKCGGRQYYTLRTANQCWTLDLYTGLWHERESYGYDTWRTKGTAHVYGKDVAIDSQGGNIGVFSNDVYTDFGLTMRWLARSGTIYNEGKRMFHGKLTLEFDKGQGGLTDEPEVMLRWSDDDGNTWSVELARGLGLGNEGQYEKRAIFNRLGSSRSRIYEFLVTDPYPVTLTDAFADVR